MTKHCFSYLPPLRGAVLLLLFALGCQAASGQNLGIDALDASSGSPAERFKAFLVSPPVIEEMIVQRSYPARGGDIPDQYYLIRYQSNAFLFATANALEPLLNPAQTRTNTLVVVDANPTFFAAGRYGTDWWNVGGLGRTVTIWNQREGEADTDNPVRLICEDQFVEVMELILFGINDITLTPAIVGNWVWTDDTFQLDAKRHWQGRLVETTFSAKARRDSQDRITSMQLDKTIHDPTFGKPRSWSYLFQYLYEPGPRPSFLPARVKKFFREANGTYREIDQLTFLKITIANNNLSRDMFMPEFFTTPHAFRVFYENGNFYYYDKQGNKVRQLAPNEINGVRSPGKPLIFYSVLILLMLPLLFFYLRTRKSLRQRR